MSDYPELVEFPENSGDTPNNVSLKTFIDCHGVLVAQDGEDLHQVQIHLALGTLPKAGFASTSLDPEGARAVAKHLLHLADYAELGVEAKPFGEAGKT